MIIGILYLDGGIWSRKQIVSTRWIDESTKEHSRWKNSICHMDICGGLVMIKSMDIQADSVHKNLYQKLDGILAKIIKPKMTTEQKIKAIHDYVVTHITYDLNYEKDYTPEAVLMTIDKGRGVCGNYAYLFEYLCDRASIPCVSELGSTITSPASPNHIWNAVFLNGGWKFVDTTWDDGKKISYKYFLNDKFTFMKDHSPKMGIPNESLYPEIDPLNIKTQDEFRVYLDREFYFIDGFKLTFRLTNKKLKPQIGFMAWSWNKSSLNI